MALVALAATWGSHPAVVVVVIIDLFLVGAVLAAVHHAEVIAHRVGEPYGSIVLAVAVTVIEVALIVTLMISGGSQSESLARDTVFAAVMITCNGIVGISILTAALRGRVASFNAEGSATAFATVITLTTLCLVLPNFTTSTNGPEFSGSQLVFAALASVSLYVLFLFVQSVRHRGLFLHVEEGEARTNASCPPENSGPGRLVVKVGSTSVSVASVATVASALAVPSALNSACRVRSVPTSSDSPTMPLQVIITAAKTVSRASDAVSGLPAIIRVTMRPTSMSVTATASTSDPNGSPTRCATTSAWWTAARTAAASNAAITVTSTGPRSLPQVSGTHSRAMTGTRTVHESNAERV